MRLPRRGFVPPRNDMCFMECVPNDKPQSAHQPAAMSQPLPAAVHVPAQVLTT